MMPSELPYDQEQGFKQWFRNWAGKGPGGNYDYRAAFMAGEPQAGASRLSAYYGDGTPARAPIGSPPSTVRPEPPSSTSNGLPGGNGGNWGAIGGVLDALAQRFAPGPGYNGGGTPVGTIPGGDLETMPRLIPDGYIGVPPGTPGYRYNGQPLPPGGVINDRPGGVINDLMPPGTGGGGIQWGTPGVNWSTTGWTPPAGSTLVGSLTGGSAPDDRKLYPSG